MGVRTFFGKSNFQKRDLQSGMIVTLRNREKYIVFLEMQFFNQTKSMSVIANRNEYILLDFYDDDLRFIEDEYSNAINCISKNDIVKVEVPMYPQGVFFDDCHKKIVYQRSDSGVEDVRKILEEQYGKKIMEIFVSFEDEV